MEDKGDRMNGSVVVTSILKVSMSIRGINSIGVIFQKIRTMRLTYIRVIPWQNLLPGKVAE